MADTGEQLRAPAIDRRATTQGNSPFDQRNHRCNLEKQDEHKECHLEMEKGLMEIVISAFFVPAEGSHPTANQ